MFGRKVECDGCDRKVAAKSARYYRGSYFCSPACRETWSRAHPPRVATGPVEQLERDLIMLVDAALDASAESRSRDPVGDALIGAIPLIGGVHRQQAARDRMHAVGEASQFRYEAIPILRALGYLEEAETLDSLEPGTNHTRTIAQALLSARARAAASCPPAPPFG